MEAQGRTTITVTVHYYNMLRLHAGLASERLDLSEGTEVVDAIRHPGFALVDIWELCTAYYVRANHFSRRPSPRRWKVSASPPACCLSGMSPTTPPPSPRDRSRSSRPSRTSSPSPGPARPSRRVRFATPRVYLTGPTGGQRDGGEDPKPLGPGHSDTTIARSFRDWTATDRGHPLFDIDHHIQIAVFVHVHRGAGPGRDPHRLRDDSGSQQRHRPGPRKRLQTRPQPVYPQPAKTPDPVGLIPAGSAVIRLAAWAVDP